MEALLLRQRKKYLNTYQNMLLPGILENVSYIACNVTEFNKEGLLPSDVTK